MFAQRMLAIATVETWNMTKMTTAWFIFRAYPVNKSRFKEINTFGNSSSASDNSSAFWERFHFEVLRLCKKIKQQLSLNLKALLPVTHLNLCIPDPIIIGIILHVRGHYSLRFFGDISKTRSPFENNCFHMLVLLYESTLWNQNNQNG